MILVDLRSSVPGTKWGCNAQVARLEACVEEAHRSGASASGTAAELQEQLGKQSAETHRWKAKAEVQAALLRLMPTDVRH